MTIPGGTSTGSKRPELLFGDAPGVPVAMTRAAGCRLWDERGREYIDCLMALGAVSLGYAHPAVVEAAGRALQAGGVGSLAPVDERRLADRLREVMPHLEAVRFLRTGAEAVAAAVRMARVATGRDVIVTCGYHGWLDTFADGAGVPMAVRQLRRAVPFNDVAALTAALAEPPRPAALVVEPVIDGPPSAEWVAAVEGARGDGVVVILDEIKTGLRLGLGGATARYGYRPDLVTLGKALGNGVPVAVVGGGETVMAAANDTWISSTWATECVGLAAALAVLDVYATEDVAGRIADRGARLSGHLAEIAHGYPHLFGGVRGIAEFCYLDCGDPVRGRRFAAACAARGVLFKHDAYNFMSVAHDPADIDQVADTLTAVARGTEVG